MTLMNVGYGDSEIARVTGIARGTVNGWRHGRGVRYHRRLAEARPSWRPRDPRSYSYLLGVYLGDGCIVTTRAHAAWLAITLDAAYPGIVDETATAVRACFPQTPVRCYARRHGSVAAVQVSHPALPFGFPQHGAGRKHFATHRAQGLAARDH
jgi:hypothetical protein